MGSVPRGPGVSNPKETQNPARQAPWSVAGMPGIGPLPAPPPSLSLVLHPRDTYPQAFQGQDLGELAPCPFPLPHPPPRVRGRSSALYGWAGAGMAVLSPAPLEGCDPRSLQVQKPSCWRLSFQIKACPRGTATVTTGPQPSPFCPGASVYFLPFSQLVLTSLSRLQVR